MNWDTALRSMQCVMDDALIDHQIALLESYLQLLQQWNKVYNLTAIRNPADMLPLHLYDSLAVLPYVSGKSFLDVGSGAGLPGIPLAIMRPDSHITMLDSNGKKTRFIQQSIIQLKLPNAQVVHERIECLAQNKALINPIEASNSPVFDAIISRAFSSLHDFVEAASPYLNDKGVLYAMKGRIPYAEIDEILADYQVEKMTALNVPGVEGERHLLQIVKRGQE